MRIDKFLKISRLVKRRPVAKEMADQGRIKVNDKVVKSSYDKHSASMSKYKRRKNRSVKSISKNVL